MKYSEGYYDLTNAIVHYLFYPYEDFVSRSLHLVLCFWCLFARLSFECACSSTMIFRALRDACARSAKVASGIFGPKCERSEGKSPNTRAEGTTASGPGVSMARFNSETYK